MFTHNPLPMLPAAYSERDPAEGEKTTTGNNKQWRSGLFRGSIFAQLTSQSGAWIGGLIVGIHELAQNYAKWTR
jgi:hypothetical protein